MAWHDEFFRSFWPVVGPSFTLPHADTQRDVKGLVRLLRLRPGARILDVPCGFGRHSVELARRGFRVTGVDVSEDLLVLARQAAAAKRVAVEFRQGDMRRIAYRRRFDAVLNLFTSFGYFGEGEDLKVLRRFRAALRPGGWLVIDVINRDWLMRNFRPRMRSRTSTHSVVQETAFDFSTAVVTTRWTARRGSRIWRGTTRLRVYAGHELLRLAQQAGFRSARLFGNLQDKPPSFDSQRQILRARR
jgi:SAM-dependent methyltransferase